MNKITLNRKYSYLIDRFEKLKKYKQEYKNKNDEITYFAMQRIAEEVVETAIKINIFILKEKEIFPKTYQESFLLLKDFLEYDDKKINKLVQTAKFRNLLSHEYINMQQEDFIKNIEKIIKSYPEYLKILYNKLQLNN